LPPLQACGTVFPTGAFFLLIIFLVPRLTLAARSQQQSFHFWSGFRCRLGQPRALPFPADDTFKPHSLFSCLWKLPLFFLLRPLFFFFFFCFACSVQKPLWHLDSCTRPQKMSPRAHRLFVRSPPKISDYVISAFPPSDFPLRRFLRRIPQVPKILFPKVIHSCSLWCTYLRITPF